MDCTQKRGLVYRMVLDIPLPLERLHGQRVGYMVSFRHLLDILELCRGSRGFWCGLDGGLLLACVFRRPLEIRRFVRGLSRLLYRCRSEDRPWCVRGEKLGLWSV